MRTIEMTIFDVILFSLGLIPREHNPFPFGIDKRHPIFRWPPEQRAPHCVPWIKGKSAAPLGSGDSQGGDVRKSVDAQMSSRCCGMEVRRQGCQLRYRPRYLIMVQKDEVGCQRPSSS
ncbi:hypothetical protein TNCV_2207291 [Trichonephila clavipes]|uniref:Uncharacterized protein n=1 Tax=Trichonephila clavipes TaxID=2585209 RepID=A0A8X6SE10_TRICX|nr:hypothetical protein TNCV_2207291 [Trichonephila clavipes]